MFVRLASNRVGKNWFSRGRLEKQEPGGLGGKILQACNKYGWNWNWPLPIIVLLLRQQVGLTSFGVIRKTLGKKEFSLRDEEQIIYLCSHPSMFPFFHDVSKALSDKILKKSRVPWLWLVRPISDFAEYTTIESSSLIFQATWCYAFSVFVPEPRVYELLTGKKITRKFGGVVNLWFFSCTGLGWALWDGKQDISEIKEFFLSFSDLLIHFVRWRMDWINAIKSL